MKVIIKSYLGDYQFSSRANEELEKLIYNKNLDVVNKEYVLIMEIEEIKNDSSKHEYNK